MAKRRYAAEQIIIKLREIEIPCNQGKTIEEATRLAEITPQTYYRWCKQYGGMGRDDVKRLKDLEKENARLKKLVGDLSLDNAVLKDVGRGKLLSPAKRRTAAVMAMKTHGVSERRGLQGAYV